MKKKIINLLLVFVLLISSAIIPVSASGVITIYSPNGGSSLVMDYELDYYCSRGWYAYPVTTMYSIDGRETIIRKHEVEYYKSLGWYTEPIVTMYALDGRTTLILQSEVAYYQSLGWYAEPLVTLYDIEGRTNIVLKSEIPYYSTKGWYTTPVNTKNIKYYQGTTVPDFGSITGINHFHETRETIYLETGAAECNRKFYFIETPEEKYNWDIYCDYLESKEWQCIESSYNQYNEEWKGWQTTRIYQKRNTATGVIYLNSYVNGQLICITYASW